MRRGPGVPHAVGEPHVPAGRPVRGWIVRPRELHPDPLLRGGVQRPDAVSRGPLLQHARGPNAVRADVLLPGGVRSTHRVRRRERVCEPQHADALPRGSCMRGGVHCTDGVCAGGVLPRGLERAGRVHAGPPVPDAVIPGAVRQRDVLCSQLHHPAPLPPRPRVRHAIHREHMPAGRVLQERVHRRHSM